MTNITALTFQLATAIVQNNSIQSKRKQIDELHSEIDHLQKEVNEALSTLDDVGTIIRLDDKTYLCRPSGITEVNDLGVADNE